MSDYTVGREAGYDGGGGGVEGMRVCVRVYAEGWLGSSGCVGDNV